MFDINNCYDCFATEPNSAYFWSGLGENGQDIAAQVAEKNGGTTLEMLMDKNKDQLISAGFPYDEDLGGFYFTKDNAQDWQTVSQAYAEQARGEVHTVLGENVRENSVWNTKELPALTENDSVNKITSVDPNTGKDKDVLLDKTSSSQITSAQGSGTSVSSNNVESLYGGGANAPNEGTSSTYDINNLILTPKDTSSADAAPGLAGKTSGGMGM